jgi:hypothetical protein
MDIRNVVSTGIQILLIFLAVSSGITKIMLMEQDVEFFGKYGFTDPLLMGFGITQLVGGILMTLSKTRFIGAAIVAFTFIVSLVILALEGNLIMAAITAVATALLVAVMVVSWKQR